jgi:hypothetical protein
MEHSETRKSVVILTTGTFESSETVEELQNRFFKGGEWLKSVVDTKGQTHWVNIAHVVHLHEPSERSVYIT